jgi:sigma-B regulation protein RsbU (phosphoserine phosphatase)
VASESQNIDFVQGVSSDLGLDVAAICNSRYEVGGDLCELIPVGEGRALVAVGDACGKSIPAAMIMASVRGALRTAAQSNRDSIDRTDVVMQQLNQTLHAIAPTGRFMTMMLGLVDKVDNTFCFTSAGHPNPILLRGGQTMEIGRSHGLMLGASEGEIYDRSLVKLEPRDTLVIFSDGISEAMSCDRRLFRSSGIMQAIRGCRSGTPRQILDAIGSNLDSHTQGSDGADDRTLLVMQIQSRN